MALPKWIEPKITVGNILTIFVLLGGILAAAQSYGAMGQKVEETVAKIEAVTKSDLPALREADVELGGLITAQGRIIDTDRLTTRETLAELKTDVGYIRRYVEEERRGARP